MSEEIIKVLDYLGAQIGIAIDWSSENVWPQVTDILGRYRLFELATTGFLDCRRNRYADFCAHCF